MEQQPKRPIDMLTEEERERLYYIKGRLDEVTDPVLFYPLYYEGRALMKIAKERFKAYEAGEEQSAAEAMMSL